MKKERGQMQLSFGMIFSIIIIIATVAIAFYVITYFLNLSKCTDAAMFYKSLETEVDNAWKSPISQNIWSGKVPSGVKEVCFGNFSQGYAKADEEEYNALKKIATRSDNVFFYPKGACDIELSSRNIAHFSTDNFFCVATKSGKVSIKIIKTDMGSPVKITP